MSDLNYDPVDILNIPLEKNNNAGAASIREYLTQLLLVLWNEGESFNGEKPFGSSGWEHEILLPLVRFGYVKGEIDENEYIKDIDVDAANELIFSAILCLGQ